MTRGTSGSASTRRTVYATCDNTREAAGRAGTSVAITGRIAGQAGGEPAARITLSTGGTGQISANGVLAASGALSLTSGTGGIALGSGAVLTGTPITLNGGGGAITLGGNAVLGEAGATVDLVAGGGGISEAGTSQIVAATLLGDTGGAASLTGTNAIATLAGFPAARGDASTIGVNASEFLAGFTAAGGLTLDDGGDLTVAGPVSAGPSAQITLPGALTLSGPLTAGTVSLTAASLNLDSTLTGTTKIALAVGGAVSETGSLDTPVLTGSSGGATSLTSGGNRIGAIDTYTAGSVLNVVDGEALTLAGVISAPTMVFNATPNQITIANGTTIVTGGTRARTARPAVSPSRSAPPPSRTRPAPISATSCSRGRSRSPRRAAGRASCGSTPTTAATSPSPRAAGCTARPPGSSWTCTAAAPSAPRPATCSSAGST